MISIMEPFDRDKFEKEWSGAMEGAEIQPSAGLWDQIDLTIAGEEGILFKTGLDCLLETFVSTVSTTSENSLCMKSSDDLFLGISSDDLLK